MEVEIIRMDDFGRGIGYINDKIVFVPKTVIGDIVNVEVILSKKNYDVAKVIDFVKPSKQRIKNICPFYEYCGGCSMQNFEYRVELEYKLNKINNLLKKNNINYEVKEIIKSKERYNYRNKISLKIIDGQIGYFENDTHNLINIDYCPIVNQTINDFIKDIDKLKIKNGSIIIRVNYKNELLIIIYTDEYNKKSINSLVKKHKISGIIVNDKCIFGSDFFIDQIGNYNFKISYNSFFQINPYICKELFNLVDIYTKNANDLIDLYSGVGTLSIVAKKNAKNVLGVEIVENAVNNAKTNSILNKIDNISFIASDTNKITSYIENKDFVIVDPPRSGLTKKVINSIIEYNVKNIIYISCDPNTLVRDLRLLLDSYDIKEYKLLDMFPNTYHVESFVLLEKK